MPGVELARGKFKHASSDEDLSEIIKNGIPGTAMPPGNFHEHQLTALIAYLRSMSAVVPETIVLGNATRGKGIFEGKGQCLDCHRADGKGSYLGPDLTDIGVTRRAAQLERSIVIRTPNPPAESILPRGDKGWHRGRGKNPQPGYLHGADDGLARDGALFRRRT